MGGGATWCGCARGGGEFFDGFVDSVDDLQEIALVEAAIGATARLGSVNLSGAGLAVLFSVGV